MSDALKILLIEDDEVDRMFFQRTLKSTGVNAELILAEDAIMGVSKYNAQIFDCVFLDYMLPGTDGLEVLAKLHSTYKSWIVIITSQGDGKIAFDAIKAGALDYISKNSINAEGLGQVLRNILRLREAEKEKNKIEEAFKQSEKRHRIFFERSQGFFCTHDLEGNFITVNHAGAGSLNYLPEELIGTNLKKLISPLTRPLFGLYLEKIIREKSMTGEMRVLSKNGEERIWIYNNYLYEDLDETYVMGSVLDITDRVKMEEEKLNSLRIAEESVEIKKMADQLNISSNKIRESINYAKRLQNAVYTSSEVFKKTFPNSFIVDYPKEIVSGDFFWLNAKNEKIFLALADCTGHGVPGALLSTLGYTMLNNIISNINVISPDQILKELTTVWRETFGHHKKKINNYDGMEIALCVIDYSSGMIEFSGMGGTIFFIQDGQISEYKSENLGISSNYHKALLVKGEENFICYKIPFKKTDSIYLFSDGYLDQFGGDNGENKFTKKQFRNLILNAQNQTMEEQGKLIDDALRSWKGNQSQTDDILVIGVQL
jgi:PAS domain S-box-containing protein